MSVAERVAERRFVWKLLAATVGLYLLGGAMALAVVCRSVRPAPLRAGVVTAPADNVQAPRDAEAPLR